MSKFRYIIVLIGCKVKLISSCSSKSPHRNFSYEISYNSNLLSYVTFYFCAAAAHQIRCLPLG